VAKCKSAGIKVRMVTGDNALTATYIAQECGIIENPETDLVMDGDEFRELSDDDLDKVIDRLAVLARSKPKDKKRLVSFLMEKRGDIVGVTGDGTNDAPALKEASVGLAMGITGTMVAKAASDIVITDDNFNSIVNAVMWGRNVYDSIRKFIQFQLTINFVALMLAFIAAVAQKGMPLNVMQLLWVNLVMDSMAALALATELPTPALLERKPYGKSALISRRMWKHILVQGLYQFTVLLLLLFLPPLVSEYYKTEKCYMTVDQVRDLRYILGHLNPSPWHLYHLSLAQPSGPKTQHEVNTPTPAPITLVATPFTIPLVNSSLNHFMYALCRPATLPSPARPSPLWPSYRRKQRPKITSTTSSTRPSTGTANPTSSRPMRANAT
jgi:magnesium-transporting ATPase (P-type)